MPRRRPRPRPQPPPLPAHFNLSTFDIHKYDVFAVCSKLFWRTKPDLIANFFAHLHAISTPGFLAANDVSVCEAVSARLGVACIVSREYVHDGALSKERWQIILNVLKRSHRIAYAGLDMRFLKPVASWYDGSSSSTDFAFEGRYDNFFQRLGDFTPDWVVAFPTPKAIAFLEFLVAIIRRRSLAGLPAYLQEPLLLRANLMGPAEQDLLKDAVLSVLFNRTVVIRKYSLARAAAYEHPEWIAHRIMGGANQSSSPAAGAAAAAAPTAKILAFPNCGLRDLARHPEWEQPCRGAGVVNDSDLPRLTVPPGYRVTEHARGTLVSTPSLSILLSNGMSIRTGALPCASCHWDVTRVLALHCLAKFTQCLNMSLCRCLWPSTPRKIRATRISSRRQSGTFTKGSSEYAFAKKFKRLTTTPAE